MILRNCSMRSFSERCKDKRIACYGIGGEFERIIRAYSGYEWFEKVDYLIDNDVKKQNTNKSIKGKDYRIISLEEFIKEPVKDIVIIITSGMYYEIFKSIHSIYELKNTECYIFHFMYSLPENQELVIEQIKDKRIPSTIHYCWFGKSELPDLYKKCIESWYKYCPQYEIKRWDENNCDIDETVFTRQAYEHKKYGFVPDYFRLKIIYEHGGIYLDTDVEMIKNIAPLCYNNAFCGLEFPGEVNLGLGFGACKNHPLIKKMMERYKQMSFIKSDGSFDETGSPVFQSEDLLRCGLSYENKLQIVDGMTIYPTEVLSPQNVYTGITEMSANTYMWHHFDGSWLSGERLIKKRQRLKESEELRLIMQRNEGEICNDR